MKLVLMLTTLASWSTGQLIYPDEFESMISATAGPQKFQSDPVQFSNYIPNNGANGFDKYVPPSQPARTPVLVPFRQPNARPRIQISDVISKGVTSFALKMDDAVAVARSRFSPGSRENVVFSPLSVAATLALVLLGSGGRTFQEVSTVLGLDNGLDISRNSESVHRMFGALISAVHGKPGLPTPESSFANGIFVREGYPIRQEFKAASQGIYGSEVINLNFQDGGDMAQKIVNAWVSNQTHGKIPSILSGPPPAETNVIIASALYFNGEWRQHFIDGSTRRKPFSVVPGETVMVDMMYNGGEFSFFEDKQLGTKIVGLPYKGEEVTMYVLLPNSKSSDALRDLERRLDANALEKLISNMETQTCIIGLPRMKLSSTLSLRDALQATGLRSLFDPASADLSIITAGYNGGIREDVRRPPTVQPHTDGFKFPNRFGGDDKDKQNFFSYDDKVRGYHVEQWSTGFTIGRLPTHRLRRSTNAREWRTRSSAASKFEEEEVETSGEKLERGRRQVDQDYLNDIDNQNPTSYGIDYIRNTVPLVNPRIYADDVLHRVEIDITEKGTEAAAATSVVLTKDGSQKRLVADRPFLFFIRHEPTGLILFWGSVTKPTPEFPTNKR